MTEDTNYVVIIEDGVSQGWSYEDFQKNLPEFTEKYDQQIRYGIHRAEWIMDREDHDPHKLDYIREQMNRGVSATTMIERYPEDESIIRAVFYLSNDKTDDPILDI